MTASHLSRRNFLGASSALLALTGSQQAIARNAKPGITETALHWLDQAVPAHFLGATFGMPWPRGMIQKSQSFTAETSGGDYALQTWPLAYWPDGSLKWTAHAVPAGVSVEGIRLKTGKASTPSAALKTVSTKTQITISTGDLSWIIPTSGNNLISAATRNGQVILKNSRLVAMKQNAAEVSSAVPLITETYQSKFTKVSVEQSGPVRTVIKFDGVHSNNNREWLPFTVRLYFYAGSEAVRIVHSFIYDGDHNTDFIRAIGLTSDVVMSDESHNRHVRFSGEDVGVWAEAVRPLTGLRSRSDPGEENRRAQVEGRAAVYPMPDAVKAKLKWVPEWGDFKLNQQSADGFTIRKRTQDGYAWIDSNSGTRTKGLAYVGGVSGGVALGLKDFWQSAPSALHITKAHTDLAELTAWLWSPDGEIMDMRSYRGVNGMETHKEELLGLDMTYEDYEAGYDTPNGIARTSELTLWVLGTTPTHQAFSDMAEQVAKPARLVTSPQRLHQAGVFGNWALIDRSTPARRLLEDKLTYQIEHYMREVEQRRWYGFWSYGDVMHMYDRDRHVWRYDIGGFAWDNSELSTDLWLWYSYLRTGRADIFRFAEAMTRHTGEVDVYHLGRFKGLGTRHGVQHWSDSSKQPRVSNAAYRRIYYYLTADERVGDLMRDLVDSDEALREVNISRKLRPQEGRVPTEDLVSASFGFTWGSFLSAWLTEWERTGDTQWRDRIITGMKSIAEMKRGWFAGEALYDPRTGRFIESGDYIRMQALNGVFGVIEMNTELWDLIDVPAYKKTWLDYATYYNAPDNELKAFLGQPPSGRGQKDAHSRLTAFAAFHKKDKALGLRAWSEYFSVGEFHTAFHSQPQIVGGVNVLREVEENPSITTNVAAQWGLATIQNLYLIGDLLDEAAASAGILSATQ